MAYTEQIIEFLIKLAVAGLEIFVGFVLGPAIKRTIERFKSRALDKGVLTFLGSFANIAIKILAIIIALSQLGVNMDVIVGMFSAVGLGVSLALQSNMANLAGGMQILLTRPFTIGDFISTDGQEGTVSRIELMYTTLVTANKQEVIIPNSNLVSKPVVNYTYETYRRIVIEVPVAANYNPSAFKEKVLEIAQNHPQVVKDPEYSVCTSALSANSNTVTLYAYCLVKDYWQTLYDLNQSILEAKLAMDVPVPFDAVQLKNQTNQGA
jgi:small conductance mechanosensitive channel